MLLGPIFKAQGWNDSPFNLYPAKGVYMWRDMQRLCDASGIPFQKPSAFPRNGLIAARLATAAQTDGAPWLAPFVRNVYLANFGEDRDIAAPKVLRDILTASGAPDVEAALERADAAEVKDLLRARTTEAQARGIFGAPSFVAQGELFWGNDRLEAAIAWCARGAAD